MQYDKFDWHDFCEASKDRDVVFFGTAETGKKFYNKYCDQFNIVMAYDNCAEKWNTSWGNVQIKAPETMSQLDLERIVCVVTSQYWYEIIQQIKGYGVKYYFVYPMIEQNSNLAKISCFEENERDFKYKWDLEHNYYAHALGVIDGIKYTNSWEAFQNSLQTGFKIFEMDLSLINGEVIGCHGRDCFSNIRYADGRPMEKNIYNTYDEEGWPYAFEQLKEEKVYGRYMPLKFEDMCEKMLEYKDIYLFLDIKYRSLKERTALFLVLQNVIKKFPGHVKDRLILQTFSEMMFNEAKEIVGFKHYVMHFLNMPMKWMLEVSCLCGINTIVVHYKEVDDYFIKFFHQRGYSIGIHGTHNKEELRKFQQLGVNIFCLENNKLLEGMW